MYASFFPMFVIVWNWVTLAQSVKYSTNFPTSPSEPKVFVIKSVTVSVLTINSNNSGPLNLPNYLLKFHQLTLNSPKIGRNILTKSRWMVELCLLFAYKLSQMFQQLLCDLSTKIKHIDFWYFLWVKVVPQMIWNFVQHPFFFLPILLIWWSDALGAKKSGELFKYGQRYRLSKIREISCLWRSAVIYLGVLTNVDRTLIDEVSAQISKGSKSKLTFDYRWSILKLVTYMDAAQQSMNIINSS